MKLSTKIGIIFSIIIILLVYVIGTESCMYSYNSTIELVRKNSKSAAKTTSDDLEVLLNTYKNIAAASGKDMILAGNVPDEARVSKVEQLAKQYGFTSGNVLNEKGISIKDGTDFSDRSYVKKALQGKTNISDVTLSKYTGTYGLSIAAPLISSGRIVGVVYFRIDVDFMNDMVKHISVGDGSFAYILDEKNNVIAHKNSKYIMNEEYMGNVPDELTKSSSNSDNGGFTYEIDSKKYICGYSKIGNTDNWRVVMVSPTTAYESEVLMFVKRLVISDIFALIIAILAAVFIARSISKPIIRVKNVLSGMADGDLSKRIEKTGRKDELGILQNSAASLTNTLSQILGEAAYILESMAAYDLTAADMKEYPGEFNNLAVSINSIKSILKNMIINIQTSSVNVEGGSRQLAQAAGMVSDGTVAQAASLQKLVADVDNVVESINRNSQKVNVVNESLLNLDIEIKDGDDKMHALLSVVKEVEEMSEDIKKIVKTIDSIAFQTNILSLNASVEAARAGDTGKGFAVVAQEIGTLAAKSSEASKKTAGLIEKCLNGISGAKEYAVVTSETFKNIVDDSEKIAGAFKEISKDNEIQTKNANNIKCEIENISDVVQANTATAEQTAASTEVLSGQAISLKEMTERFKAD